MMGLGYRRANEELMKPRNQHKLRRADEDLMDLIVLGAILAFAIGTTIWILLEDPPIVMFYYYAEREEYMGFFYSITISFFLYLLFYWLFDLAPIWPRILIAVLGIIVGFFLGILGLGGAEFLAHRISCAIVAAYSFLVAGLAAYQVFDLPSHKVHESN